MQNSVTCIPVPCNEKSLKFIDISAKSIGKISFHMKIQAPYKPKNKIRIVTAASLFDGHDAAINIMRRIIQSTGVEVIHLGHDRSVEEVVNTAIQEDANAIALTSYQGGHNEYFKYMFDLLQEKGASQIRIFGGGGGVILPDEIKDLMDYGVSRIYAPDDGRAMGLQGMINDMVEKPAPEEAPSNLAVIGRYILTPRIFKHLGKLEKGAGNETWQKEAPTPAG